MEGFLEMYIPAKQNIFKVFLIINNMAWFARQLRGTISTRAGVFVAGYKTKFAVDPGLQDTIVPIASAQISALASRNTSSVYVYHDNRNPPMLPPQNIRYFPRRASLDNPLLLDYDPNA